jgi:hypothetical protein
VPQLSLIRVALRVVPSDVLQNYVAHAFTPLQLACEVNSGHTVALLAEHGVRLEDYRHSNKETPLCRAARSCSPSAIEALLAAGATTFCKEALSEALSSFFFWDYAARGMASGEGWRPVESVAYKCVASAEDWAQVPRGPNSTEPHGAHP